MWGLLGFALGFLDGLLLLTIVWPAAWKHTGAMFSIALSALLGLGLTSATQFLSLLAFNANFPGLLAVDLCLTGSLALIFFLRRKSESADLPPPVSPENTTIKFALITVAALGILNAVLLFCDTTYNFPEGTNDSYQIWNTTAKFVAGGDNWREYLNPKYGYQHPDYPLLLPATIGRHWAYSGNYDLRVPQFYALILMLSALFMLYAGLKRLVSVSQATLGVVLLGCTTGYSILGAFQYADVPISTFMLASALLSLLCFSQIALSNVAALAGFTAACAAWTKNEGLAFWCVAFTANALVAYWQNGARGAWKHCLRFVVGSAPILLLEIYFKAALAPPNDLFAGGNGTAIVKKTLTEKLSIILEMVPTCWMDALKAAWFNPLWMLLVYLALAGIARETKRYQQAFFVCLLLAGMCAADLYAYLITPYDLKWHVSTSMNRLMLQLWPMAILAYFLIVRAPEEAAPKPKNI